MIVGRSSRPLCSSVSFLWSSPRQCRMVACRSWTCDPVLDRVQADLVGRAVGHAALDAAAGHPDREAVGVVVAAVAALAHRRAAELAAPDHQRRVEQAAPLQVLAAGPRSGRSLSRQ